MSHVNSELPRNVENRVPPAAPSPCRICLDATALRLERLNRHATAGFHAVHGAARRPAIVRSGQGQEPPDPDGRRAWTIRAWSRSCAVESMPLRESTSFDRDPLLQRGAEDRDGYSCRARLLPVTPRSSFELIPGRWVVGRHRCDSLEKCRGRRARFRYQPNRAGQQAARSVQACCRPAGAIYYLRRRPGCAFRFPKSNRGWRCSSSTLTWRSDRESWPGRRWWSSRPDTGGIGSSVFGLAGAKLDGLSLCGHVVRVQAVQGPGC